VIQRNPERNPEMAKRLKRLRDVYGPSQIEFCRRFGFTASQWSNYESGTKPSLAAATQLVRRIDGLSLDWIYFGRTGGLTIEVARRLGEG
jgi:transcriptional regulator with XRE-family HTH domain